MSEPAELIPAEEFSLRRQLKNWVDAKDVIWMHEREDKWMPDDMEGLYGCGEDKMSETQAKALVELIARGIYAAKPMYWGGSKEPTSWEDIPFEYMRDELRMAAEAAISAVNGSGTHAVLPVEATAEMLRAGDHAQPLVSVTGISYTGDAYRAIVAAHLKAEKQG